jgi:hypothetical protein
VFTQAANIPPQSCRAYYAVSNNIAVGDFVNGTTYMIAYIPFISGCPGPTM